MIAVMLISSKYSNIFPNVSVKLDLFHACQRITRTFARQNALHKEVSKSFVQIFRDDDDQGEKRLKSTVYKEKMEKNLNSFIERWSNVLFSPLTEATFIEIENLRKHIQKGCLSEIPPGCGTERNEGLHRLLNRSMISGATTLSVQLAIALLTLLFYHHNQKISAEKHCCSSKIKPVAPVESNVTSCNALTGNAEFETESVDDKVRQPQFSTELDIEDGKIFQISENSFASSNPFVMMVETIEDPCQESIAAALISATYNLSEMIKKVKEKNNDRSFNALDIVHLSKMTKLLTSEDNIDTDDPTINSHSDTLKRHLATFNLQLDMSPI